MIAIILFITVSTMVLFLFCACKISSTYSGMEEKNMKGKYEVK
jgi:hypothetical protein